MGLNMSHQPEGNVIDEEGYDRMRDDRLVKYGIGHDGSDRKSTQVDVHLTIKRSKVKPFFRRKLRRSMVKEYLRLML